jgi:uncharacterized membrane protein YgaE (UPF0421/DUF939 family)
MPDLYFPIIVPFRLSGTQVFDFKSKGEREALEDELRELYCALKSLDRLNQFFRKGNLKHQYYGNLYRRLELNRRFFSIFGSFYWASLSEGFFHPKYLIRKAVLI